MGINRHYGRGEDGLSVVSIDLPDGRTGWVIDSDRVDYLDTRHPYPSRAAALDALARRRRDATLYAGMLDAEGR